MKKTVFIFLLLFIPYITGQILGQQNLSKLSEKERNEKLIEIAMTEYKKDKYKEFYRIYKSPIITKKAAIESRALHTPGAFGYGGKAGDIFYMVQFPYDESKEQFEWGYAAIVYIWEKTGKVFAIKLGSGMGHAIN